MQVSNVSRAFVLFIPPLACVSLGQLDRLRGIRNSTRDVIAVRRVQIWLEELGEQVGGIDSPAYPVHADLPGADVIATPKVPHVDVPMSRGDYLGVGREGNRPVVDVDRRGAALGEAKVVEEPPEVNGSREPDERA